MGVPWLWHRPGHRSSLGTKAEREEQHGVVKSIPALISGPTVKSGLIVFVWTNQAHAALREPIFGKKKAIKKNLGGRSWGWETYGC